jgi:hypothetical protein
MDFMGHRVLECAVMQCQELRGVITAFNLQILLPTMYVTMPYFKGGIVGLVSHGSRLMNYPVFFVRSFWTKYPKQFVRLVFQTVVSFVILTNYVIVI